MKIYWIYVNIIFVLYFDFLLGKEIFVNINKDKLSTNTTNIKIFNGDINVTGCPYLRNINKSIHLDLNDNLTSIICNTTSDVIFYVFTYHTNISPSMVIVENKLETLKTIRSISLIVRKQIVILSIQNDYVIFVICQGEFTNCQYRSVDQREIVNNNNLTIYSGCNGLNGSGSCITEREFLSNLSDANSDSPILGSKINIKMSNMEPKYENEPNCLNGGVLAKDNETQRFICSCPKTRAFYESGPRCESLQQVIDEKQYLYILPNTNKILIEFSLFSPAHSKGTEIFNIQSKDGFFMKYTISDVNHLLTAFNRTLEITKPLDVELLRISIEISNETAKFRVNNEEIVAKILNVNPFMLDTFPLVIQGRNKDLSIQICLSNLKINQQIIDLYTPYHTACVADFCLLCKWNEMCLYEPFKSSAFKECICKSGFVKTIDNPICMKNDSMTGQINGNIKSIVNPTKAINMKFINFKFRTILTNGILVKISIPTYTFSIRISSKLISTLIYKEAINKTMIIPINYYNVADGYWHTISFELTHYFCKITLDENIPFNSNSTHFDSDFADKSEKEFIVSSVTFGPLLDENSINSSIITCFDTLTIYNNNFKTALTIDLNGTMPGGCNKGSNCSTVVCSENQKCVEKWQNNSCVCEDTFTDINGTCYFTKCIINPCKNNGVCSYDVRLKNYKCKCLNGYTGNDCDFFIATAKFTWWIILIIALLILIILIIILYFLCCWRKTSKRNKRNEKANINEIHENVVSYNDGAGETDYKGPPIDFEMLNYYNNSKNPILKEKEKEIDPENFESVREDLMARKHFFDNHNTDLIIDHPLTYTFEGFDSDLESVSSLESFNNVEPVNVLPLPRKSSQSKYLNNLKYKM